MGLFAKKKARLPAASCGAVIVAAGKATRMEGIDKVMALLGEEPILAHAVRAFQCNAFVTSIVVVTREDLLADAARMMRENGFDKVKLVIPGGETRTESVQKGLEALPKGTKLAAIHDAARPLIPDQVITDTILKAADTGAAAPAIPVKDTVKRAENGVVCDTPERSTLFAVQTPQVFDLDLIRCALQQAQQDGLQLTDDCMAVERLGMKVHLTKGSEENFKVTTPLDLVYGNALLELREGI